MLDSVPLSAKRLDDYRTVVGEEEIGVIRQLAEPLKGARVLHINATATGGGVAEILASLVPLMRDAGLDAEWQVILGDQAFFTATKACHNGLQGQDIPLTPEIKDVWQSYNSANGDHFDGEYDFVIVHDPQPAGLLQAKQGRGAKHWLWRCHIDTSSPNPAYWDFFAPKIGAYDALIFTMPAYVGPGINADKAFFITPTIDPLSLKNLPVPLELAQRVVGGYGLDLSRPLITQVSRFDPWKDPLGVIDAYRLVKRARPDVQLALVGAMAGDDPEGWDYLNRTTRRAGEDPDLLILHNFQGIGAQQVACFQSLSDVVIQKSLREGFGLVVTEAMWKARPVVAGNVGGIPLQVLDGETGYLVDSVEGCAERTLELLDDAELSDKLGSRGREHVREHFLTTHHLKDYLGVFKHLASRQTVGRPVGTH